jgi:hypothetical protein
LENLLFICFYCFYYYLPASTIRHHLVTAYRPTEYSTVQQSGIEPGSAISAGGASARLYYQKVGFQRLVLVSDVFVLPWTEWVLFLFLGMHHHRFFLPIK